MFERRLKIFLTVLFVLSGVLVLRAVQIQIAQRGYWRERASQTMKRSTLIETTRGRILDFRGREIAVDLACIDACVDFRVLQKEPDAAYVRQAALRRVRQRLGDTAYAALPRPERRSLLEQEILAVRNDIGEMFAELARVGGVSLDEIDQIRRSIVHRVEMRQRYVWYRNYEMAMEEHRSRAPSPWYRQWLISESAQTPQLDSFAITVSEQTEAHAILRAISGEAHNLLGKNIEKYPGLVLRPGKHRRYPYGESACHVLGHLSRVAREDLSADPNVGDELRQYYPNDLIGRTGLEALFETSLRGMRGRVERLLDQEHNLDRLDPVAGADVRCTIDIELQRELQMLFRQASIRNPDNTVEVHEMHGAAVIIDVPSGQVRAMVSFPTFDPNTLDENYSRLATDDIDRPLLNRATQNQLEPGSTIKPLVGVGAITAGAARADEGIECTGYLILHGKRYNHGRCWVASKYAQVLGEANVKHHPVPSEAPHPTGHLTLADAIERSCNIYFEVLADRLGTARLSQWLRKFGLGQATGIGIPESTGRLPDSFDGPADQRLFSTWMAGIGQGPVAATPLQMANAVATIARGGIWMRPTLFGDDRQDDPARVVDLKLSPDALAAAREGMLRVVNARAGTGRALNYDDTHDAHRKVLPLSIAGKTGTAQAAKFSVPVRDEAGRIMRDEHGRTQRRLLEPHTKTRPNAEAAWYLGTGPEGKELTHAWFVGFAPADQPRIAFAVLVEYGGSGGQAGAALARRVLEACVEHGYLPLQR